MPCRILRDYFPVFHTVLFCLQHNLLSSRSPNFLLSLLPSSGFSFTSPCFSCFHFIYSSRLRIRDLKDHVLYPYIPQFSYPFNVFVCDSVRPYCVLTSASVYPRRLSVRFLLNIRLCSDVTIVALFSLYQGRCSNFSQREHTGLFLSISLYILSPHPLYLSINKSLSVH